MIKINQLNTVEHHIKLIIFDW